MRPSDDAYFTQVPHWLLGGVSARAIEVYVALGIWSSWDDAAKERERVCWPKRELIRSRLRADSKGQLPSLKSLDRWLLELVNAGAIRKQAVYGGHEGGKVKADKRRSSNRYQIAFEEPFDVSSDTSVAPAATPESPMRGDTHVATEVDPFLEPDQVELDERSDLTFGENRSAATPLSLDTSVAARDTPHRRTSFTGTPKTSEAAC